MSRLSALAPGLALAVALALAGQALVLALGAILPAGQKFPISGVTLAILLGLLLANAVALPAAIEEGARFAVTHVLRAGIVLLGLRLSFVDVASIGSVGLPLVVVTIAATLLIAAWLGRALAVPARLATLIGVVMGLLRVSRSRCDRDRGHGADHRRAQRGNELRGRLHRAVRFGRNARVSAAGARDVRQ